MEVGHQRMFGVNLIVWLIVVQAVLAKPPIKCLVDDIKVMDNFDINKLSGKWLMMELDQPYFFPDDFPLDHYLETSYFTAVGDVIHMEAAIRSIAGAPCFNVSDTWTPTCEPGKYHIHTGAHTHDWWLIDTDYDNFVVFYGCGVKRLDGTCQDSMTVKYIRSWDIEERYITKMNKITEKLCVKDHFVKTFPGEECPVPTLPVLQPPVYPTQCDDNDDQ